VAVTSFTAGVHPSLMEEMIRDQDRRRLEKMMYERQLLNASPLRQVEADCKRVDAIIERDRRKVLLCLAN